MGSPSAGITGDSGRERDGADRGRGVGQPTLRPTKASDRWFQEQPVQTSTT